MSRLKKSFGQHFLTNPIYLNKIIESVNLQPNDVVVEIGSGSGNLTILLAKSVKKVFAVEMERDVIRDLKCEIDSERLNNVQVVEENFLNLKLKTIIKAPFKVIGNIPYNITSKILFKLFGEIGNPQEHFNLLESMFLMLQKEVACRLCAKPGSKTFSPLTLGVQYFTCPEIMFLVPSSAFSPPPKVESAFVKFNINKTLQYVENPELLKKIIKISFQQKRKKIINSMQGLCKDKGVLKSVLDKLNLDASLRAEDLSFDNYLSIVNVF